MILRDTKLSMLVMNQGLFYGHKNIRPVVAAFNAPLPCNSGNRTAAGGRSGLQMRYVRCAGESELLIKYKDFKYDFSKKFRNCKIVIRLPLSVIG